MVDGDEGGEDGGEDGLRILPPKKKSWIDLSPETKIMMVAVVCFVKAPLLLGKVFSLIYEGIRRRPEARRCPRPIWGGGARRGRHDELPDGWGKSVLPLQRVKTIRIAESSDMDSSEAVLDHVWMFFSVVV